MVVHAVRVDTAHFSTTTRGRRGSTWWAAFLTSVPPSRTRTVAARPDGRDLVDVHCDDAAHAAWFHDHAVRRGVHGRALRVVTTLA